MGFINSMREWFSASRRQAIYVAVAAIVPVLVLTGIITDSQTEFVLTIAAVVLQVIAAVLALLNLSVAQAGEWFVSAGRATIYTLAVAAAPAAVGLGWISEAQGANALTIVSVGLTVLAAVIGVAYLKPDVEPLPELISA